MHMTALSMQARLEASVESLQYELYDPEDPHAMEAQRHGKGALPSLLNAQPPVVILGFNEASQARPGSDVPSCMLMNHCVQCVLARAHWR
jgi:hypothetical protein